MFCADEKSLRALTHWIVADLNVAEGRALLAAALKHLVCSLFSLELTQTG